MFAILDSDNSNSPLNCTSMDMLLPCILHMNSLLGIHNTEVIANLGIAYLKTEKKSAKLKVRNCLELIP